MGKLPIGICLFFSLITVDAQEFSGKILSSEKENPIAFANIGILGKNRGTVSDERGNYRLNIQEISKKDTIQISKIGYESVIMCVEYFTNLTDHDIYLSPKNYKLPETNIISSRKIKMYGEPVHSSNLINTFGNGFGNFWLGQELGSLIDVKRKVLIRTININIGVCSFDSVQLRLNIYKADYKGKFHDLLKEPIYFSFLKEEIKEPIAVNVAKDSILVNDEILISIEFYKHLGKGNLGIYAKDLPFKESFFRNSSEAPWQTSPGRPGLYLYGEVVK